MVNPDPEPTPENVRKLFLALRSISALALRNGNKGDWEHAFRICAQAGVKVSMLRDSYKEIVPTVTVCANCKRASCWYGSFMCDDSKTAGTIQMTLKELRKLKLESPTWWTYIK